MCHIIEICSETNDILKTCRLFYVNMEKVCIVFFFVGVPSVVLIVWVLTRQFFDNRGYVTSSTYFFTFLRHFLGLDCELFIGACYSKKERNVCLCNISSNIRTCSISEMTFLFGKVLAYIFSQKKMG